MSNPYTDPYGLPPDVNSKKILCGIMGILFGGLGIHRFILGDTAGGLIRIVITILTCGVGSIIGLIEGVIYLTKTDPEFYQTYMVEKKAWF
jgi:TM2 domain-containing membrane protein YozV